MHTAIERSNARPNINIDIFWFVFCANVPCVVYECATEGN